MSKKAVIFVLLMIGSAPAWAYIGPGSGISLLSGLWAVLVAIVLSVGAVLIWPVRYGFRRIKRKLGLTKTKIGAEGSTAAALEPSGSVSVSSE